MKEKQPRTMEFDWQRGEIPLNEISIKAVRGGGPGGQAVNKTANNVEVRWRIAKSTALSDKQKDILREVGQSRITKKDELIFTCQDERSLSQNTQEALQRLNEYVREALTPEEDRIETKKSRGVKARERQSSEADKRRKAGRKRVHLE